MQMQFAWGKLAIESLIHHTFWCGFLYAIESHIRFLKVPPLRVFFYSIFAT